MLSHAANMLGALSLVLTSRIADSVGAGGHLVGEDAAAVVLLGVDALTIKRLAEATGVTHSGGVRMVDRLERAGLVQRGPGPDRRTVTVSLTPTGIVERDRVLAARAEVLGPLLDVLEPRERELLGRVLHELLGAAIETPVAAVRACRLCDEDRCVPLGCPVEDRYRELLAP